MERSRRWLQNRYDSHLFFCLSIPILPPVLWPACNVLADNINDNIKTIHPETKEPVAMTFFQSLVIALILTILIEFAIYFALIRQDPPKLLWYSALINSFTNPLFNYLYNYELHDLYLLESAVALVECFLICHLLEIGYRKAMLVSFLANLASLLIGLIVFG